MAELMPLSEGTRIPLDRLVAVDNGKAVTAGDLMQRMQRWMAAFRSQPGTRWAVYHSDAFEFLAILFALWQLKRTACIPGDNLAGTVARLEKHVDGFAGEFLSSPEVADEVGCQDLDAWKVPDRNYTALEIYTSGSTGEPKPITKSLHQLEQEVESLESLWPSKSGSVVLATVSHQHLYGMMFRLFWPFSSGRIFERKLCEYSEDIQQQAQQYASFSLISSPSHLGRLNNALNWGGWDEKCQYLISSAAPLSRVDSLHVSQLLGIPVREIYGSSETGAIAWRMQQRNEADALWQALPNVDLSPNADGTLCVKSPYLGPVDQFSLPDRVAFDQNACFKLLGRVDRIVKVEGKRVSLVAIEQALLESDLVKNAKALTLERTRVETAVVIELSEGGLLALKDSGRKPLIKRFKALLAPHFEAVVQPRRWRFVEQLPYNQQGKLPLDNLRKMFSKETVSWPKVIREQVTDRQLEMQCVVPADLIYFDGHFASNPILPGIVQVHWAEAFGRQRLAVTGSFKRLEVVKFQQVILPESSITVSLSYDEVKQKLTFKYQSERGVHSSGRICFG